jgi:hypothetical protein
MYRRRVERQHRHEYPVGRSTVGTACCVLPLGGEKANPKRKYINPQRRQHTYTSPALVSLSRPTKKFHPRKQKESTKGSSSLCNQETHGIRTNVPKGRRRRKALERITEEAEAAATMFSGRTVGRTFEPWGTFCLGLSSTIKL